MADLNKLFSDFNKAITLSSDKKASLKTGRNALRDKIKKSFKEKERYVPNFFSQGSFMMKTTVNPLGENEYDIDDGVYIKGYDKKEESEWPPTQTVHNWIYDAVVGHTSTSPVDKNTCIRVIYAKSYHIDLPAYIVKDEIAYLAHTKDGWIVSDPKAFSDWFIEKVSSNGEQVRSVVKYLKAWKDYNGVDLKGIVITILVSDNFYSYTDRDDKSLLGTVSNIISSLEEDFECIKPVLPNENLLEGTSDTKKNTIIDALYILKDSLSSAINEEDEAIASDKMIEVFGERFPKGIAKSENSAHYIRSEAPSVIKNDGKSA